MTTRPPAEWQSLQSTVPFDPKDIMARLRAALDQAEAFVTRMPTDKLGLLFLDAAGHAMQPDPDRLDGYQTHTGQRRGQWPDVPEIRAAMFALQHQAGPLVKNQGFRQIPRHHLRADARHPA